MSRLPSLYQEEWESRDLILAATKMKIAVPLLLAAFMAACASSPPANYDVPAAYHGGPAKAPKSAPASQSNVTPAPQPAAAPAPKPVVVSQAPPSNVQYAPPPDLGAPSASPPPAEPVAASVARPVVVPPNPMVSVRIVSGLQELRNAVDAANLICGAEWLLDGMSRKGGSALLLDQDDLKPGETLVDGVVTGDDTATLKELERALRGNDSRAKPFSLSQCVEHCLKKKRVAEQDLLNPQDMKSRKSYQITHLEWLASFCVPEGQNLCAERRLIEPTLVYLKRNYPAFEYELR